MPTYVSLLRGINVGGNKTVKMAELAGLYESLGLTNVATVLQSGNVVFRTEAYSPDDIARTIEVAIHERFGFHTDQYVFTAAEFGNVVAANPFAGEADASPAKLLVYFLRGPLAEDHLDRLLAASAGSEQVHSTGRALYVYFPDGLGRSKLGASPAFTKIPGTGRNWNTVSKVRALLGI